MFLKTERHNSEFNGECQQKKLKKAISQEAISVQL